MSIELTRLAFGFLLWIFHRPLADFMLQHERSLVLLCRQRGLTLPSAPSTETSRSIYFVLGAFVVLSQLTRIWLLMRA